MNIVVRRLVNCRLFPVALAISAVTASGCAPKFNFKGSLSGIVSKSACSSGSPSTDWNYLGEPGFSTEMVNAPSMALDRAGYPYVAYTDWYSPNKLNVMHWNGVTWSYVGNPGLSPGVVQATAIAIDNSDHPYVAYEDSVNSNKLTVEYWDGTSWSAVGTADFSNGAASNPQIFLDKLGTPYVGYSDSIDGGTVKKWNGSSWVNVGTPGSMYVSGPLAIDGSGNIYCAFSDGFNSNKATVEVWNGTSWSSLGGGDFSAGATQRASMVLDSSGNPYVAYQDEVNGYKVTVMHWNGSSWITIGSPGFSIGIPGDTTTVTEIPLALDSSNRPYIAYEDESDLYKGVVEHWNGSSWSAVGMAGFTDFAISSPRLAVSQHDVPVFVFANGVNGYLSAMTYRAAQGASSLGWSDTYPKTASSVASSWQSSVSCPSAQQIQYFADEYCDVKSGSPISLSTSVNQDSQPIAASSYMSYRVVSTSSNGEPFWSKCSAPMSATPTWTEVGSGYSINEVTANSYATGYTPVSIAVDSNGHIYAAYSIWNDEDTAAWKAAVAYWDGSSWMNLGGSTGFSAGEADNVSIALDSSDDPYVAFRDFTQSDKLTVMHWNGTAWTTVGTAGFSAGTVNYVSLAVYGNTPYVAYSDYANSKKATVMYWNGSNWVAFESADFSAGEADYISMALDPSGNPYVVYTDVANSSYETLMYWNGSSWTALGGVGFSGAQSGMPSLALHGSTPVVALAGDGIYAMEWNGTSWITLGGGPFNNGSFPVDGNNVSMALDSAGNPYIASTDYNGNGGGGISVSHWDGSNWSFAGEEQFSPGEVDVMSIVIDGNDVPYVGYVDDDWNGLVVRNYTP